MSSIEAGQRVFRVKSEALYDISIRLGEPFEKAVDRIMDTPGRVIVSG